MHVTETRQHRGRGSGLTEKEEQGERQGCNITKGEEAPATREALHTGATVTRWACHVRHVPALGSAPAPGIMTVFCQVHAGPDESAASSCHESCQLFAELRPGVSSPCRTRSHRVISGNDTRSWSGWLGSSPVYINHQQGLSLGAMEAGQQCPPAQVVCCISDLVNAVEETCESIYLSSKT